MVEFEEQMRHARDQIDGLDGDVELRGPSLSWDDGQRQRWASGDRRRVLHETRERKGSVGSVGRDGERQYGRAEREDVVGRG
jgi:hypothetical protein